MKRLLPILMLTALLTGCACAADRAAPAQTPSPPLAALEAHTLHVLQQEMPAHFPLEALKAQAIVARTNAYRLMVYDRAALETPPESDAVPQRLKSAVEETTGLVLLHDGQPINAWFHEHAGGVTALAREGLDYAHDEPAYTRSIQVRESPYAPQEVRHWQVQLPLKQVQRALDALGGGDAQELSISQRRSSGRVTEFSAGEALIRASALRSELGGSTLPSTLLAEVTVQDGLVTFTGSGSGHGVGLSQWGAYEMAAEGKSAEDILHKFYQDVSIARVP